MDELEWYDSIEIWPHSEFLVYDGDGELNVLDYVTPIDESG